MRGLWTAGVTDVMMEHGVWPDGLIGVSAGAAFGCNIKSRQPGRAIRYNVRFAHDARFSGLRSLLISGDYYNADFGYHVIPSRYDIFDESAFDANPMEFVVVCTDVLTGRAVYQPLDKATPSAYDWIRASASMPLVSRVVSVDGRQLLDGGISDSIPLEHFERSGYDRNVVVLTQPLGYQKSPNRLMPIMRLALRHYPRLLEALEQRHVMYNRQLDYVAQAEREGRCLVIRPDERIAIGHVSHNPARMQMVYDEGRRIGEHYVEQVKRFFGI